MGSKKRRSSSTTSPSMSKRRKSTHKPPASTNTLTSRLDPRRLHPEAAALYSQNSQTPLLRLPREIRDQIWALLYGNLVVHPDTDHDSKTARRAVHPLQFKICGSFHTPKEIYDFSLQGALSHPDYWTGESGFMWAAAELQSYHFCSRPGRSSSCQQMTGFSTDELRVPIVCRQVWNEMSDMVYETCIFAFTNPNTFNSFLSCRKTGLERIRRLLLAPSLGGSRFEAWNLGWWALGRMKGVRSLDLWVMWQIKWNYVQSMYSSIDLGDEDWYEKKKADLTGNLKDLQTILRELRWDLRPEQTRVVVDVKGSYGEYDRKI
ncbi:hypothetical protein BU23DRAFT_598172 [Bimuria novae-zelandiae CBS 107.79]|uniref:DUF7730 domain-containing protein n=1 Tax=Bimuria novae-zelandiae CBS 107.79 TaxID=1447943 RepID=A0A6A5VCL3_9PLEO|nr:hypothetical protein BU23DRAFT_598172 [Bimuria novae-zelandiae CBS 107.79]